MTKSTLAVPDVSDGEVKTVKIAKDARDPEADFHSSLYEMGEGIYGFPVTGLKKAILSAAHKSRNVPRTEAASAIWFDATMVTEAVGKPSHVTRTQFNDGQTEEIWTTGKVQDRYFVECLWIFFKNNFVTSIHDLGNCR